MAALLDRLDDVCTAVYNKVNDNAADIGLTTVDFGDMPKTLRWPAAMVVPGEVDRRPEASFRQTELTFTVLIYVLHADLTESRSSRTHTDLQLAESITDFLHSDFTFGGQLAGSWVAQERPRMVPTRRARHVIATELTWTGKSRGRIGL